MFTDKSDCDQQPLEEIKKAAKKPVRRYKRLLKVFFFVIGLIYGIALMRYILCGEL